MVECSSYQIDLAPTLDPRVGILINVSEDHLDRHGTLEHYAAVKERLVAGVQADGTAVIGVDDEWCAAAAERVAAKGKNVVRISVRRRLPDGIYAENGEIIRAAGGKAQSIASARRHRLAARPAQRAERGLRGRGGAGARPRRGGDPERACARFPASRTAWSRSAARARCCSSTTPRRPTRIPRRRRWPRFTDMFWIAGGKPKTGGITSLAGFFPRIRKAYLIGEAADEFARTLDGKVAYEMAGTLDRAVEAAARDAAASGLKEPVVLLSPACASFDQYRNFEVRGDHFRELVLALPGIAPIEVTRPRRSRPAPEIRRNRAH